MACRAAAQHQLLGDRPDPDRHDECRGRRIGVKLEIKAVGRRDELVAALHERRDHASAATAAPPRLRRRRPAQPAPMPRCVDRRLGKLRETGVLTDERALRAPRRGVRGSPKAPQNELRRPLVGCAGAG